MCYALLCLRHYHATTSQSNSSVNTEAHTPEQCGPWIISKLALSGAIQVNVCAPTNMPICCVYHCRMVLSHAIHATCAKLQMLMCCMYDCRMALSDAKGDVDDRVRDLAASERELEKADFDLRYKTHEAKLVNKAAVAKRTEVGEVHKFCHAVV